MLQPSKILLLICFVLSGLRCWASEEPYFNELRGAQVAANQTLTVVDDKFRSMTPSQWSALQNISVKNVVAFELNYDTSVYFYAKPFSCTLNATIHFYANQSDTSEETASAQTVNLTVRFDTTTGKPYTAVALYRFTGAYKFTVVINSISSPELGSHIPPVFRLSGKTVIDRQYPFTDASTDVSSFQLLNNYQLQLNWTPANYPGAESYDLEWTVIDSASQRGYSIANSFGGGGQINIPSDTLDFWFTNNSTRINTVSSSYTLSLPYNSGYLLYRIRGVQVHYPDNIRYEGTWNYQAEPAGQTNPQSSAVEIGWHERGLNWQYTGSFSEEGKRAEVIRYSDGTKRERQSVTINTTEHVSVVGETIYDEIGRDALDVLPGPTTDSTLHYFRDFNLNTSGAPYTYSDFAEGPSCQVIPGPMSIASGASRYYSPQNPFPSTIHQSYIPNAHGFPFAVKQYTPDHTGRVYIQSGVDTAFQPGHHVTSYFYGKPLQPELDRLFGSEAGVAAHFLKNMVVDPNGQVRVYYINSSNKTVATALAGRPPTNVDSLPSTVGAMTQLNDQLLRPADFVQDASSYSLLATTTFLAPMTGSYRFTYEVDPLQLVELYGLNNQNQLCSSCYYDLVIHVKDDCNNILYQVNKPAGQVFDTACGGHSPLIDSFAVAIPAIGEYYVDYTLQISQPALNFYDSVNLKKNTNILPFSSFLTEELKKEDFSPCFADCSSCLVKLGSVSSFLNRFQILYQQDSLTFGATDSTYLVSVYGNLLAQCQSNISSGTCGESACDQKLDLLKADVTPGGQYALYDSNFNILQPSINVLSKFQTVQSFPDANGNPDSVTIENMDGQDSVRLPVNQLSVQQFIVNFQPSWADSLVRFHPEYCYYLWCVANSTSYNFDQMLQNIPDGNTAVALGDYSLTDFANLLEKDPFFAGSTTMYNQMYDSLQLFSRSLVGFSQPDKNILQVIKSALYCSNESNGWDTCSVSTACRSADLEWPIYLQFYLNLKTEFYQMARMANPQFANCNNCHIGQDPSQLITMPVPPAAFAPVQGPACNTCTAGVYKPTGRPGVSYYIEFGVPTVKPTNFPAGYGNATFYANFSTTTGNPINPLMGCQFANVWVAEYDTACCPASGGGPCVCAQAQSYPSTCPPVTSTDSLLATKQRDFYEYTNPNQVLSAALAANPLQSSDSSQSQYVSGQGASYCSAQAAAWMQVLSRCHADPTKLAQLSAALTSICSGGYDSAHLYGSSSLPMGASGPYTTFEQAIAGILGAQALNDSCTSELLSMPYPYDHQPIMTDPSILQSNAQICAQLAAFQASYASSGYAGTLQQYLQASLGSDYQLTTDQLNDLINSCTNCNGVLHAPITLPAALQPGSAGGVSCGTLQNLLATFRSTYPGLDSTDPDYEDLYANFLNHRLGFALGYDDYQSFLATCGTGAFPQLLYNKPVSPTIQPNDNSCVQGLFADAETNAQTLFTAYIDSVRQAFRNAYLTRCMALQPSLNLEANVYEYHYMLYYYDQNGDVVKTVPPAGVHLLNAAQIDSVDQDRQYSQVNCYEYADELQFDGSHAMTFSDQSWFYTGFSPFSIETYLRFPSAGNQGILSHFNSTTAQGYQLLIRNDSLVFRMGSNDTSYLEAAAAPVSQWTPYNQWAHVVIERIPTFDTLHQVSIFINGVQWPTVTTSHYFYPTSSINPATPSPLLVGGSGTNYFNGRIKQFRFYLRDLPASEIQQNYFNTCLEPASQSALVFWMPMGDGTGNIVDILHRDTATWASSTAPDWINRSLAVYPQHTLATTSQYNSIGQLVWRHTPDADSSNFWYDQLGRMVASQNQEQLSPAGNGPAGRFSYTLYDPINRVIEVGEKTGSTDIRTINTLDTVALKAWMASGTNEQVTRTIYDTAATSQVPHPAVTNNQQNLRKKISAVLYWASAGTPTYDQAIHYSYDIEGNVQTLWREIGQLRGYSDSGLKRIDYDYDLVSGKVNQVSYQAGKGDEFLYRYTYDASNRLTDVETSRDSVLWTQDAAYQYYLHGPLARMELGQYKVQGLDYAYTLQGWLKAINGHHLLSKLDTAADMNQDGWATSPYSVVSRDDIAFGLGYYTGDYDPIGGAGGAKALGVTYQASAPGYGVTGNGLYNGNVTHTTLALSRLDSSGMAGYSYRYDQLNRLLQMRRHGNLTGGQQTWSNASIIADYREQAGYDPNGNIQTYLRNGTTTGGSPLAMDQLSYAYQPGTNRLDHIGDVVPASNYNGLDIDNEDTLNYRYDQVGELMSDAQAQLTGVQWTAYGKIAQVSKSLHNTTISYAYDPMGERVYKHLVTDTSNKEELYVRDIQGNILALYDNDVKGNAFSWEEQDLYGARRLGAWLWGRPLPAPVSWSNTQDSIQVGFRAYELTNHLENVLGVISDKKIGVPLNDTVVDHYVTEALSQNDYYPFGMLMPGRQYTPGGNYRYGFNGKENDNEVKGVGDQQDYGLRIYDPRVARFLSTDPLGSQFPYYSPYEFAGNKPILAVDLDGGEVKLSTQQEDEVKARQAQLVFWNAIQVKKEIVNQIYDRINFLITGDPQGFRSESEIEDIKNSIGQYVIVEGALNVKDVKIAFVVPDKEGEVQRVIETSWDKLKDYGVEKFWDHVKEFDAEGLAEIGAKLITKSAISKNVIGKYIIPIFGKGLEYLPKALKVMDEVEQIWGMIQSAPDRMTEEDIDKSTTIVYSMFINPPARPKPAKDVPYIKTDNTQVHLNLPDNIPPPTPAVAPTPPIPTAPKPKQTPKPKYRIPASTFDNGYHPG